MKKTVHPLFAMLLGASAVFYTGCQHRSMASVPESAPAPVVGKITDGPQLFGWPFAEGEQRQSRGGTTAGAPVELDLTASAAWQALQEAGLSDFERDRRAILAMAGDHRVSFQFVEVAGMDPAYTPKKPYFSWSTERVAVIEDSSDFISLQHTLVMFFELSDGTISDPMLVKHWRQDWKYEDTQIHAYTAKLAWTEQTLSASEVDGVWSQTVYQVDDSPRYEVFGEWVHGAQLSTWQSNLGKRPLPRREFSVRDDYDLLEGWNTVTVYPTGWLHEQSNFKLALDRADRPARYVAKETGINRYDRITSPSLEEAAVYWERTSAYWAEVRDVWSEIYASHGQFGLRSKVDDQKLYEAHFGYAGTIKDAASYDAVAGRRHARETIEKFLILDGSAGSGSYLSH